MQKREIKFRVWIISDKRFAPDHCTPYNWYSQRWNENNLVFQQWTGLFDTTGKHIFEGDIFLNGESKRVIEFRGGNFHAVRLSRTDTILLSFVHHQKQNRVIGNIFENPELLEKP